MSTAMPLAKTKSYIKDNVSKSVARGNKETRKSDVKDSLMKFLQDCGDDDFLMDKAFSPPNKSLSLSRSERIPSPGESRRQTRKESKPELHQTLSKNETASKGNFFYVGQGEHGTTSTTLSAIPKETRNGKADEGQCALICNDSLMAESPNGSVINAKKRSSSRRRSSSRTPLKRSSSERHDESSDQRSRRSSSRTPLKRSSSERHDESSDQKSRRSSSRTPLKRSSSERQDAASKRSTGRAAIRGVPRTKSDSDYKVSLHGSLGETGDRVTSSHRRRFSGSVSGPIDDHNRSISSTRSSVKRPPLDPSDQSPARNSGRIASRGVNRSKSESASQSLPSPMRGVDLQMHSQKHRNNIDVGGSIDDHSLSCVPSSGKPSLRHRSDPSPGRTSGRGADRGVRRAKSESATKSLPGPMNGVGQLVSSQRRPLATLVSPSVDDANEDDDGCSILSAHSTVSRQTGIAGRSLGLDAGPLNGLMNSGQRRGSMAASSGGTVGSNDSCHKNDSDEDNFLNLRRKRQEEIMNQARPSTREKSASDQSPGNVHEHLHDFEVGDDDDQPMTGSQKISVFARLKQGISKTGRVTKNTAKGTVNCVRDPKRVAMKVSDFAKDLGKETGKMLLDPKLAAMTAVSIGKDVTIGTYKVTREVGMGVALGGLGLTKTVARTGMDATSMVVEGAGKVVTGATGLIFKQHNDEEDKYDDYNASERADRRLGQKTLLDRFAKSSPPAKTDGGKSNDTRLKNYLPTLVGGNGTNQSWDY